VKRFVVISGLLIGAALAVGSLGGVPRNGHPSATSAGEDRHLEGDGDGDFSLMRQLPGELAADMTLAGTARRVMQRPATAALMQQRGGYGIDLLVNDPSLDRPEHTTQSEPTMAVRGSTICVGYNDTNRGNVPNPLSGFSRSADRGASWTDRGYTGPLRFSDPVLAVHKASGRFYYASLSVLLNLAPSVGVATSTDDCQTFPTLANASPSAVSADLEDKPWITVDNSGGAYDGNVYVCWTRFVNELSNGPKSGEIHFSRSTDGGATFTDEQTLSPSTDEFPFDCNLAVGAHGEVYLAWSDRSAHNPLRFRRSFDGGRTWDVPVQVNTQPIREPGTDRPVTCEAGSVRSTLNGDIRMLVQATMAVDRTGGPFTGNLYMVWGSDPPGDTDNADIFISRSSDGGQTWTPEMPLAGGTDTDQFFPAVTVGGAGTVAVAWYDRRNDPANNFMIDVYTTLSRDGGASFGALQRITDVSFPVPPINHQPAALGNFDPGRAACYMGDYIAIDADDTYVYYAWGDNRNTVVSSTYPDGRPDPDVYFDRLLISCGDGVVDANEQCDDGNLESGDACDANCTLPGCGNGIVDAGEECDDGNRSDGDGCQADCTLAPAFTPTITTSPTPTTPPTATPTATPGCAGDCTGDGTVTIDELIIAVNIALGSSPVSACMNADTDHDGSVTINEIIAAVNTALNGCVSPPTG